ncbi:MAG: Gfo/Idh/MocA family oxidoreductase [Planctomycetia bacterium]|nr:Gfo/Idh/MocA family oxidoreductase [Planctomycetia bacterium]
MQRPTSDHANSGSSRRQFLRTSTALAAAGGLAATLGSVRNAHAAGSDVIKVGLIGAGGRGTGAVAQALNTSAPVKLVAVADAFPDNVQTCVAALKEKYHDKVAVPADRQFAGLDAYRKVLATDCDVVILATAPGFRPIHFEAAIKAGKHVFMEKPVATDAAGVRKVLEVNAEARKKNLAVAVGLQRRHEAGYKQTIDKLRDGAIGDIILARAYWDSNGVWTRPRRPGQTELEYQVRNWYYFNWLCGDHIVEQHIHNLDVINWLMDGYPVSANGMGGRQVRTGKDHGEIFDHHFVEYTYANGTKLYSQCRHIPGCLDLVNEFAHGTKGNSEIGRGLISDRQGKELWKATGNIGGGHQQEQRDFFAQIHKGEIPNEAEVGAKSTMTAIMGRMATYSGLTLTWDQCLNSKVDLGVKDFLSFDETAPVLPDSQGAYRIPTPGMTKVV